MKKIALPFTLVAVALLAAGCAHRNASLPAATATLAPTAGSSTTGIVRFAQVDDGTVRVVGEIRGLAPGTEHGFHVHEKGDCTSGDGMSAGGHFNPAGEKHGRYDAPAHHAGDLRSVKADARGIARLDYQTTSIRVTPGATSIVGRGLIVHRDPDDYVTQPTGNAGPRLACAVIVPF